MSRTGQPHAIPTRDINYNGPAKIKLLAQAEIERRRRHRSENGNSNNNGQLSTWPDSVLDFFNADRNLFYRPHHQDEWAFVKGYIYRRYNLLRGGEGGGKSVAGIMRDLEKIKLGTDGVIGSPDLPHFRRSLWPEMRRWIPWDQVVKSEQRRGAFDWEPPGSFTMHFKTGSTVFFMGFQDALSLEGPNVHFAHIDEARRLRDAQALKKMDGRLRILGPNGEPPQMWLTTTPRMNWLYEYFGDIKYICESCNEEFETETIDPECPFCHSSEHVVPDDPWYEFKEVVYRVTLLTEDNLDNIDPNYLEDRGRTLTEDEKRVYLYAEWGDVDEGQPFLPHINLWDACRGEIPPITMEDQIVVALDASINNDTFVIVGVSFMPGDRKRDAIRFFYIWEPKRGQPLNYLGTIEDPGPERVLRWLCHNKSDRSIWTEVVTLDEYGKKVTEREYNFIDSNIVLAVYDQYQLHSIMTDIDTDGLTWVEKFGQQGPRLEADKFLLDKIMQKAIVHDGDPKLRSHLDNADRKLDNTSRKLRIVKRFESKKIDLAVGTSMATYALFQYIGEPADESPFF